MLIAVALLRPGVSFKALESFQDSSVNLQVAADFDHTAQDVDAALVFGGDGTIHRYLAPLHAYKIPVLMVPKGSGNDFAKALGIKTDAIALQAWKSFCTGAGNVREIDLGVVRKGGDKTFFCCVAGAGLDSAANARANRMPAWLRGSAGYVLAAVQALIATRPAKIKLSTAEQTIERTAWFVAAGNAHRYGGGFKVVPQASLDDGYLDICFVGKMNKVKVACCLPLIYWGAHTRLHEVECLRAKSTVIESERPLDLYADGEYVCQTPVEIGLISKGLRVIVPVG